MSDNSGSAFPVLGIHYSDEKREPSTMDEGMSLRDYFAGQALMGAVAINLDLGTMQLGNAQDVAEYCYTLASAMLKEREERG